MRIPVRSYNEIQRSYRKITSDTCFGLVYTPSYLDPYVLERVVQEGRKRVPRDGFRMDDLAEYPLWIKKLGNDEHDHFPAERFTNGVALSFAKTFKPISFPKPLGIVYEGNGADVAAFERTAYMITPYLDGPPVNHAFIDLTSDIREQFFWRLGLSLKFYAEEGLFPLDIAPRDIIYQPVQSDEGLQTYTFTFVDSEHLSFLPSKEKHLLGLREEQKAEFRREYDQFLGSQLDRTVEIVFGE